MTLEEYKQSIIKYIDFGIIHTDLQDAYSIGFRNGIRWCKSLIDGAEPIYESAADAPQTKEDIYPLVIIEDRYNGTYSKGGYTAWNMYFDEIPQDIDSDDLSCYDFWHSYNGVVGLGRTPNEAIEDLRKKLQASNRKEYR